MSQNNLAGAMAGAVVGAVVGTACLAAVSTATHSSLFTTSAVQPAVTLTTAPINARYMAQGQVANAPIAMQQAAYQSQQVVEQPHSTLVYGWAFGLFAAVAGAINGLFILNNRRIAMASTTGRREALMAGVAAAGMAAGPAFAAYGDSANVFGKPKETNQFFDIQGDVWKGYLPSKYNASKEREAPGMVARWEDNFDAVNNAFVVVREVGKASVTDLGSIDEFRNNYITKLLGQQAFDGASISEGGFAPGRFSSAAILDQSQETKDGKVYYYYEFLTRTADGNEGGRHQLFSAAVSNGKLVIFKSQAGDKRWFKGLERPLKASVAAFRVV